MSAPFATLPPATTGPKPYFPALTGLRMVAAWMVFLYHFHPLDQEGLLKRALGKGYNSLAILCMLSGYLATYVLACSQK